MISAHMLVLGDAGLQRLTMFTRKGEGAPCCQIAGLEASELRKVVHHGIERVVESVMRRSRRQVQIPAAAGTAATNTCT